MNNYLKSLGSRLLLVGSIGSSLLLPTVLTATPSLAGADDGVKCPADFEATFNESTKVLRCVKNTPETRPTLCVDPLHPHYKKRKDKKDVCAKTGVDIPFIGEVSLDLEKKTIPVVCPQISGDGFRIDIDGGEGSRDICKRTIREFRYPNQL